MLDVIYSGAYQVKRERFYGVTTYKIGDQEALSHETHMCFSKADVEQALINQFNHFTKELGATIISQKIVRETTAEVEVKVREF